MQHRCKKRDLVFYCTSLFLKHWADDACGGEVTRSLLTFLMLLWIITYGSRGTFIRGILS